MIAIFGGSFLEPNPWAWAFGNGIGTNIGASIIWVILAGIAVTLLWPPLRRRIHRFLDRKLAPLHEHLAVIRAHAEHQTRIAEDHYEKAFGDPHPDAGKLAVDRSRTEQSR